MDELRDDKLQALQASLQRQLLELTEQLQISQQAAGVVTLDQTSVGRVSRIDALQQQSMAISTREMAALKLKRVKLAIQAIADNNYGYCQKCDETIAYKRLLAQPEANLCLLCQDKADRQQ